MSTVEPGMAPVHLLNHAAHWSTAIDAWTAYLIAAGHRPRTITLRRYQIGRLAEAHLRRSPWSLTAAQLLDWLAGQSWGSESRKSYRAALRSFYGWARRAGETRRDPTVDLPPVATMCPPPRPTPEDVLERALAAGNDRDRLILLLAAYGGLRRAEIAGLRWADVGDGALRVHGKGGRIRLVPLHARLRAELAVERDRRHELRTGSGYRYRGRPRRTGDTRELVAWVLPGRSGGHITPDAAGRAASRALGPGWTGHTLRHRFATRAYAGSRDLLAVQQLLGHTNPETTQRYTKLADDSLAAAVAAV